MSGVTAITELTQADAGAPKRSRRAWMLLASGVLSLVLSLLLGFAAVFLVVSDSLPDIDAASTGTAAVVLGLLALFAAALGWLGLRMGMDRLSNRRRSYYPGF